MSLVRPLRGHWCLDHPEEEFDFKAECPHPDHVATDRPLGQDRE